MLANREAHRFYQRSASGRLPIHPAKGQASPSCWLLLETVSFLCRPCSQQLRGGWDGLLRHGAGWSTEEISGPHPCPGRSPEGGTSYRGLQVIKSSSRADWFYLPVLTAEHILLPFKQNSQTKFGNGALYRTFARGSIQLMNFLTTASSAASLLQSLSICRAERTPALKKCFSSWRLCRNPSLVSCHSFSLGSYSGHVDMSGWKKVEWNTVTQELAAGQTCLTVL